MEYRGTITRNGLLGFVTFVNTTTVDNADAKKKLFETSRQRPASACACC